MNFIQYKMAIRDLSINEWKEMKDKNAGVVIIDVRTPEEFEGGRIEGATNIDFLNDNFEREISKLNKEKVYMVYCRSGSRSFNAMNLMEDKKFSSVYNLSGGVIDWVDHDLELTN